MDHRYGRHGPRAWLRQCKRRSARLSFLPVPVPVVPTTTIVYVTVPATTERVIFIIMTEGAQNPSQENFDQRVIEMPVGQQTPTVFSYVSQDTGEMRRIEKDDSPLAQVQNYAERQARQDVSKIRDLYDDGYCITLRWDTIVRRNKIFAENILWGKIYVEDSSPDEQTQEQLVDAYHQAYKGRLEQSIERYELGAITDPHVARIRQIAMQDRVDYPPTKRESHRFHQRDLGMIRVLHEIEISVEDALDRLPEIHELADEYDKYYANPKEGTDWPDDQEPFPCRNF